MAQRVKNLPAMQETLVPSPGWEDLLEKGIAIHSSILASKIPWTEKLGGLQTMGSHRTGYDLATVADHHSGDCDLLAVGLSVFIDL